MGQDYKTPIVVEKRKTGHECLDKEVVWGEHHKDGIDSRHCAATHLGHVQEVCLPQTTL